MSASDRLGTLKSVAPIVKQPLRMGIARARGKATVGRYNLRGSNIAIHLRHDELADLATLVQTFGQDHYVLPPEAERALAAEPAPHAMDLGANIGMFGAWFLSRYPAGRVTAYEADPANARIHGMTVDANKGDLNWELVAAAAGASEGEVRFVTGRATNSRLANEDDPEATVIPQRDVLARATDVDLLKIDIEGAEWALLDDERFAQLPAKVVALEYHSERCPGADPHAVASSRLRDAGFLVADGDLHAPTGHGMVWGWKTP